MTLLAAVTGDPLGCPWLLHFGGLKKLHVGLDRFCGIRCHKDFPVISCAGLWIKFYPCGAAVKCGLSRIEAKRGKGRLFADHDPCVALFLPFAPFYLPRKHQRLQSIAYRVCDVIGFCSINLAHTVFLISLLSVRFPKDNCFLKPVFHFGF